MALFDLLGRRWAMGVLWTLCEAETCAFGSLQQRCESISPAVLNRRLRELQAAKFVTKLPDGYAPTQLGRKLYEQLVPLGATAKAWDKLLEGEKETTATRVPFVQEE